MGTYTLKTIGKSTDYMTIIKEMEDGYVVKIVRDEDGYDDVTTDYISKTLFDSCIRTGYLTKVATEDFEESYPLYSKRLRPSMMMPVALSVPIYPTIPHILFTCCYFTIFSVCEIIITIYAYKTCHLWLT